MRVLGQALAVFRDARWERNVGLFVIRLFNNGNAPPCHFLYSSTALPTMRSAIGGDAAKRRAHRTR